MINLNSAKETLQQIKRLDNLIECQTAEIERIMELITRVTPVMKEDGSSGGGFADKIGNGVAKIVDLRNDINKSIDEYADAKASMLKVLKRMKNPEYQRVLYLRYFHYKTWEEIAADMKYSYRGICYLHGRALLEFEKEMKNDA